MRSIEQINQSYLLKKANIQKCQECIRTFGDLSLRAEQAKSGELVSVLSNTLPVIQSIEDPTEHLNALITVVQSSIEYLLLTQKYRGKMLALVNQNIPINDTQIVQDISKQRAVLQQKCDQYAETYHVVIDSFNALFNLLKNEVNRNIIAFQSGISELVKQAKEYVAKQRIELDENCFFIEGDELPNNMIVAKTRSKKKPNQILLDIGEANCWNYFSVDLRNQGNTLVETDFKHTLDSALDNFVLAYIFKFIEAFPVGSVNVHIFDKNPNRYNKRLSSIFNRGDCSELAKKTVALYDYRSLSDLCDVARVIRDDVFPKTSSQTPDLFALRKLDKSDAFNLFVLRDGLLDDGAYASNVTLDLINSVSKPGESGHASGIRFLIIDDSLSQQKNLNSNSVFLIESIHKNCEMKFCYNEGNFRVDDKEVKPLTIKGDIDSVVYNRAIQIAEKINGLQNQHITVSDISDETEKASTDSIFRIPIGKSGNDVVKIPFSCKDDRGTVEGQCVGYMIIGQSGSGKSSFFHSLIINGCLAYSPKQLQFWLLDFKFGGASSKYRNSKIPHVRIVAENNKIDDALCLFQMIRDEMESRNKILNKASVDNIVDYNMRVSEEEQIPRIFILIDEVQEIFREDSASEIQKMISSISVRMRSVGMHFIMIAQNLSEGKSYMLKEAFLPSATGRICFRVSENMPRESGFDDSFVQRKGEIVALSTGEAYVSWGKDTIQKVKMVYISPDDMSNKWFEVIKNKYPDCNEMSPMVIGTKKRLSITSILQSGDHSFEYEISKLASKKSGLAAVIGEDCYRMSPMKIAFSSQENSAVLILGEDKNMASSICTSMALSLKQQGCTIHLFNADKVKMQFGDKLLPHSFAYLCSQMKVNCPAICSYRLDQFVEVVQQLYDEYLERVKLIQQSEEEDDIAFEDRFLIVNDLFGIESFVQNIYVQKNSAIDNNDMYANGFDFSILDTQIKNNPGSDYNEGIQAILEKLLKDGYRCGIHMILAIKGDPYTWRNIQASDVNRVILFNTTQYASQVDNQFFVKEMLRNIESEEEETLAAWIEKKHISKIRPILYDMSCQDEAEAVCRLLGDE